MRLLDFRRLTYFAFVLLLTARPACGEGSTLPVPFKEQVFSIDQKIMLACIELARFNLRYHSGVNRKNFSQEWLYPMQREAGTALSFSNTVIDISQRSRALKGLSHISKNAQKSGVTCALIGQAITGGSSAVELLQNLRQSAIASSNGYSAKQSVAAVKALERSVDELLVQRSELVKAEQLGDQENLYALQGRLLEHIKNQLIFEYKNWSVSSRSTEWSENTFYALDSTQGFLQMSASCLALKGFSQGGVGGKASIINVIANSIVMFNPLVKNAAGKYIAAKQRKYLNRVFPQGRPQNIDQVLAEYDFSLGAASSAEIQASLQEKELAFLVRQSANFDGPLNKEVAKVERLRRIADQQAISGPLIGLTGVTRSVLNTVAYYQTSKTETSSSSSDPHTKVVANQLNLAGRIVQSAGQGYSLLNTPYTELRHYQYKRALEKAGNSPAQRLQARLSLLDRLEMRIKSSRFERQL